ncbi:MAG TPA: acyl-CoA dehydrogenase family protein [Gemmatimonadales bacterium]|nr:acyl-CoA dehydrogenase family protein [Gemmatimonadales bacterium]
MVVRHSTRRETLASLVAEEIRPNARRIDQENVYPVENLQRLHEAGVLTLCIPERYGGGGGGWNGDYAESLDCLRLVAQACPSTSQALMVNMLSHVWIAALGSDQQRERLFSEALAGKTFCGWASEPSAGKVETRLSTTATRVEGGYRVEGVKYFATGSGASDYYIVFCQDVSKKRLSEGLLLACIPADDPCVEVRLDWDAMGQRGTNSGSAALHGCVVPDERIIGSPGAYFSAWTLSLFAQLGFAAIYLGAAEGALQFATDYIMTKARAWPPATRAVDDPYIQHLMGELSVELRAAGCLLRDAAEQLPAAETESAAFVRAAEAANAAKVKATTASLRTVVDVFQACGASSTKRSYYFPELALRSVRTLTLHDPVDRKLQAIGKSLLGVDSPRPGLL